MPGLSETLEFIPLLFRPSTRILIHVRKLASRAVECFAVTVFPKGGLKLWGLDHLWQISSFPLGNDRGDPAP